MILRDPLPWIATVLVLCDDLRPSPGRRAVSTEARALARALPKANPKRVGWWAERIGDAIRDLPDPPPVPWGKELALLHACMGCIDPACDDLLGALERLVLELEDEIRGWLRWRVSLHAASRWQDGVDPECTTEEALATIYRVAGSAVPAGRRRDCAVWVSPEAPLVHLCVRDATVVTVMTASNRGSLIRKGRR